ncbi:MAG: GntR family transcriptional regulator [Erysipelotrichaceae bacterium]|nr:MAG: GntR family transcriptional [Erysipelotrichaceae bacterium]TXT19597.1 MAG: GntR family transcriptional regulator [Erysipelotrichaceae bacterium]
MIVVNGQSITPIYQQIIEQVLAQIASGILIHDDPLPGIRTMAKDLGINPNTVVKAYTELEREGFVYSLTGKGYYVSTTEQDHSELKAQKLSEIRKSIEYVRHFGVSESTLIDLVNTIYKEIKQ